LMRYCSSGGLFALALVSLGAACGITYTSSMVYCLQSGSNTGAKGGTHETILITGFIVGSFTCGVVAQKFGLRAPYLFCYAFLMIVIALEVLLIGLVHRKSNNSL